MTHPSEVDLATAALRTEPSALYRPLFLHAGPSAHEQLSGVLGAQQLEWLTGELRDARPAVTLILAMHHPVFSADRQHGSNLGLRDALDRCFASAHRVPDAVFSAHAHNYQRFSRVREGREIPYVVAGSGGRLQHRGSPSPNALRLVFRRSRRAHLTATGAPHSRRGREGYTPAFRPLRVPTHPTRSR